MDHVSRLPINDRSVGLRALQRLEYLMLPTALREPGAFPVRQLSGHPESRMQPLDGFLTESQTLGQTT